MDELQIQALEANGYAYLFGSIVDADGNYVPELNIGENNYTSESSEDAWNSNKLYLDQYGNSKPEETNIPEFAANPNGTPLLASEEEFQSWNQTQAEQGNLTYANLGDFQRAMEQEKEAQDSEQTDIATMRAYQEKYPDIVTDDLINNMKQAKLDLDNIKKDRVDRRQMMNDISDDAREFWNEKLADNGFLKGAVNMVLDLGDWANSFNDAGDGMVEADGSETTPEEKAEYLEIIRRNKKLKEPIVGLITEENQKQLDAMQAAYENEGGIDPTDMNARILEYAIGEMKKEQTRLNAWSEGDTVFNILNKSTMGNLATLGIGEAYDELVYKKHLMDKIEEEGPESLTEQEMMAARALASITEGQSMGLEQKGMYGITEGTFDSISFLVGGAPGRFATRGLSKGITKGVGKALTTSGLGTKSSRILGKGSGIGAEQLTQAVIHPATGVSAIDRYYGDIHFDTNDKGFTEITTDRRTYNSIVEESNAAIEMLENTIETTTDPDIKKNARIQLNLVQEQLASLKKPDTAVDAIVGGFTDTLKENVIEQYLGKGAGRLVNNKFTRNIAKKKWAVQLANSQGVKGLTKLNNTFAGAKNKINTSIESLTGLTGSSRLVGNNLEEIAEEVVTQAIPVYGETELEAKQRTAELFNSDFYVKVGAQTLLMGGIMKGAQSPISGYNAYKNYKKYGDQRKAYKEMMNNYKENGMSEKEAEEFFMKNGMRQSSSQEYNNKVKQLRDEGRHQEANQVEADKIYEQGAGMIQMGRGKQFISDMNKLISQGKVSPEAMPAVMQVMNEVKGLQKDMENHGNLRNSSKVMKIKSSLRYTDQMLTDLDKRRSEILGENVSTDNEMAARNAQIDALNEAKTDLEKSKVKMTKQLGEETSSAKRRELENIQDHTTDLAKQYKKLEKEYGEGKVPPEKVKEMRDNARKGSLYKKSELQAAENNMATIIKKKGIAEMLNKLKNEKLEKADVMDQATIDAKRKEKAGEELNDEDKSLLFKQDTKDHVEEIADNVNNATTDIEKIQQEKQELKPEGIQENELGDPENDVEIDLYDDLPRDSKGELEDGPLKDLSVQVKNKADKMEKFSGQKPTFEDYISELISSGVIQPAAVKSNLRALGLAWTAAGLGKSNFLKVQKDLFEDLQVMLDELGETDTDNSTVEETVENKQASSDAANKQAGIEPIGFDPNTNQPIYPLEGETREYGDTHSANYSAIEHREVVEVTEDGKEIRKMVSDPIPQMKKDGPIKWQKLANPNTNNAGTVLTPRVLTGDDLLNTPVSSRDKDGNKVVVTFGQWVDQQEFDNMDDFMQSEAYINKVPMGYFDADGDMVAMVADTERFDEFSVGDPLTDSPAVDSKNLTESHKKAIQDKKDSTANLRAGIVSGEVTGMEIVNNMAHPPLQYVKKTDSEGAPIPLPNLNSVAPESKIVQVNRQGHLIDENKNRVDQDLVILNYGESADQAGSIREVRAKESNGVYVSEAVNANTVYYLNYHGKNKDGKDVYIAVKTMGKNENGENQANSEDIDTARYIMAANKFLTFGELLDPKHPFYVTKEQAQDIADKIKKITGLDISGGNSKTTDIVEALLYMKENGKMNFYANWKNGFGKKILAFNKASGTMKHPNNQFGNNFKFDYVGKNKPMISIKKSETGSITVAPVAMTTKKVKGEDVTETQSYSDFVKERRTTTVMGYNVGTQEKPVFVVGPQQKIELRPITRKVDPASKVEFKKQVEVLKEDPKVIKKVEETKTKDEKKSDNTEERNAAMETAAALAKKLNLSIRPIEQSDDMIVSEMTTTEEVNKGISNVAGLSVKNEEELITYAFSLLAKGDQTQDDVTQAISKLLNLNIEEINQSIAELESFTDNPVVQNMVTTLEDALDQNFETLAAMDKIVSEAMNRGQNQNFITDTFSNTFDFEANEKNYAKSSAETKSIDKAGVLLKRIYAQIQNDDTGFMGVPTFPSFKKMYDTVTLALAADPSLEPNFNSMMGILSQRKDSVTWMGPLIEAFKQADEQTQNILVYNAYQHKVKAQFAALEVRGTRVNTRVFDSNANEAMRAIQTEWRENFKRGPINNEGKINKDQLKVLMETWNAWTKKGYDSVTVPEATEFLSKFGINLSPRTMEAIFRGELNSTDGFNKLRPTQFVNLFAGFNPAAGNTNRGGVLFSNLIKYAYLNKDKEGDIEFYQKTTNHPFDDMGSILKQLAELESKYNTGYGSTTRYVAGKSVSEMEGMTYFYEQMKKLKQSALSEDKKALEDLKKLSYSQDSFLLDMLINDPDFANKFGDRLVDLMALKDMDGTTPLFAGVDDLSEIDYLMMQRTFFQDRKQGGNQVLEGMPFGVRMSTMSTLTNSDKGRMMMMKTAVLDLYAEAEKAFDIAEDGTVTFKQDLNNVLYKSLVMPEMRRMVNFVVNSRTSDIEGYAGGAIRFNLIPALNTIKSQGDKGQTILESIEAAAKDGKTVEEVMKDLETTFKNDISGVLQDSIIKEAQSNVTTLNSFANKTDEFNNTDYISKSKVGKTVSQSMLLSELDYTINSMMSNMNFTQLIAGDPALYYNAKQRDLGDTASHHNNISRKLGINLGKRMAAMIAPGSVLTDSQENEYNYVFLADNYLPAQNLDYVIALNYGKEALNEVDPESNLTYRELVELSVENDFYAENLQNRFPKVAGFVEIEATDAQEYTTLKEALYVLEKQGRISKEKSEAIQKAVKEGKDLSKEDLAIVLQPQKPVYTGTVMDIENDVNRMMYIKSSSFPLIPQLTRNMEIDNLRLKLESIEETTGKTTRAGHHTANKVGGVTAENRFHPTFADTDIMPNNMMTLNRTNFRIQQDVVDKTTKEGDDTVSMGTQIFKLLMGDGVTSMKGFELNGEEMTGQELRNELDQVFAGMVNLNKDKFLTSLGLDDNMQPIDKEATLVKMQTLLLKEARSRGFSKQDLKILDITNDGGNSTFKLPLWMTGQSNKYEAMLNALINNKIFKQKIPGVKFVAASESGMKFQEGLKDVNPSKIIYIGKPSKGQLKSTNTENGQLNTAEIFVPSTFKVDGKLVDMFEDFDGNQGTYIEVVDGHIQLKENMVNSGLLDQFVFRIPTSSHALGSKVTVKGFLPPESGSVIMTPAGFIAQMGQDFDVDSLTAYQHNHLVMEDGQIVKLTEGMEEAWKAEKQDQINILEKELRKPTALKLFGESMTRENEAGNKILEALNILDIDTTLTKEEMIAQIKDLKQNLSKDFALKLLQNKFIDIHLSVFSNPAAQKLVQKELSMTIAEDQADAISSIEDNVEDTTFNILSPKYQQQKLNAGSTGKVGIGIYAKAVTLHSLAEQAAASGQPMQLGRVDKEGNRIEESITIGNMVSTGKFGNLKTIETGGSKFKDMIRYISAALDEKANTATDNEKAQILGRVGLNHRSALAVDSLLTMQGFDLSYTELTEAQYDVTNPFHKEMKMENGSTIRYAEHSIPYLLHSQPIIKELFALMQELDSQSTEFVADSKAEAMETLINKYSGSQDLEISFGRLKEVGDDGAFLQDNSTFTGNFLENQLRLGSKADPIDQLQILALYSDLIGKAEGVKEVMRLADLNNLGKSMWESGQKVEDFIEVLSEDQAPKLLGAQNLVGEIDNYNLLKEKYPNETIIPLNHTMGLRPTTNQGVMVGTALSLNSNLFSDLFPAKSKDMKDFIDRVIKDSKHGEVKPSKRVELQERIFQEIKKYLTANAGLGLFETSPKETRDILFMDTEENTSLSSYLGNIKNDSNPDFIEGLEIVKGNLFLNILKSEKGENGMASILKFNNQESFEVNQEAIYTAVKELIAEDIALPPIIRNGVEESYSTRKLAQELTAYSYASGGVISGAIEFHKYLPIEYLDDMQVTTKKGNTFTVSNRLRKYNIFTENTNVQSLLKSFVDQYFQHNPKEATTVKKMQQRTTENGEVYYAMVGSMRPSYVRVPVKTRGKQPNAAKNKLYKLNESGVYDEIAVLGQQGMSEYSYLADMTESTIGKEKVEPAKPKRMLFQTNEKLGEIPKDGSDITDFLLAIEEGAYGNYENMQELAGYIKQFVAPGTKFNYTDANVKGRVVNGKDLYINPDNIDNNEDLAVTFMHEVVHVLTSNFINDNVGNDGQPLENAAAEVISLNNVRNAYSDHLKETYGKEFTDFMAKFEKYETLKAKGQDTSEVSFSRKEINIFYPSVNLKEFSATSLGNNKEFKKEAKKVKYLQSNKDVLQKTAEIITKIIKRLGKRENIQENNVALQSMEKSMSLIQVANKHNKLNNAKPVPNQEIDPSEFKKLQDDYGTEPAFDENYYNQIAEMNDNLSDPDKMNDNLSEPETQERDENTIDLLPMPRTKKCK